MFTFDQDHLRVLKPITTDGLNLALDIEGKRKMKTVYMPLTAEPYLRKRNDKLPDNLKMIIERVQGVTYQQTTQPNEEVEALKKLLAQAEAEKERLLKEREANKATQKKVADETK